MSDRGADERAFNALFADMSNGSSRPPTIGPGESVHRRGTARARRSPDRARLPIPPRRERGGHASFRYIPSAGRRWPTMKDGAPPRAGGRRSAVPRRGGGRDVVEADGTSVEADGTSVEADGRPWRRTGRPWRRTGRPWRRTGRPWRRTGVSGGGRDSPWRRPGLHRGGRPAGTRQRGAVIVPLAYGSRRVGALVLLDLFDPRPPLSSSSRSSACRHLRPRIEERRPLLPPGGGVADGRASSRTGRGSWRRRSASRRCCSRR
jgi:hypothetical protein